MAKNNTIRFSFIGAPVIAKDGILDEIDSKRTGGKMYRLHFGIKVDTSTEFVGLLDYPRDTLKPVDADFNSFEVAWADREDPDVLAKVARSRLYRTNVGCEDGKIKSFISGYDFIKYLADVLPGNDKDLTVTGTCKVRYDSKGILRRNLDIQAVWYRRDTEKPQLAMSVPLTYWKDCVDNLGLVTALAQISHKYHRLLNLTKGTQPKVDESIRDTLLDLSNYCILTVMELDKERMEGKI